ncbi:MAG: hypothetical protein J5527_00920 [Treponema sp.]|nr:hypothetical protein [Treponema sp.]
MYKKLNLKYFIANSILVLCLVLSTSLISCKEEIVINEEQITSEALVATVKIPEYVKHPDFSSTIKEEIEKDFENYKEYAEMDFPYSNITSTYRTETEDFSNSKYLNCFVKKYIYAGENIEDEYFITFVYNKKTKKIETLENLTGKSLEEIGKYCERALLAEAKWESEYEKNVMTDDIKNGTRPVPRNYKAFVAGKKEITIHFSSGQVLSNWWGPQKVTIPLK